MTILHFTVPDDHVLRWDRDPSAVSIPSGLDSDAIVSRIERAVFDQDVAAGVRIASVVVGSMAHDLDVAHGHIRAEDRIDFPHGRIVNRHAFYQDVSGPEWLDKIRPQETAFPKEPLRYGNISRAHVEQTPSRLADGLDVGPAAARPDPPMVGIGVSVQGPFARDSDILLAVSVEERRIIHALGTLPSRLDQGQVTSAIADELQRRTSGYVQVDVALEMNRRGGVDAARYQHVAATGTIALGDGPGDRVSRVLDAVRDGAVFGDVEIALRKGGRLDSLEDLGDFRPRLRLSTGGKRQPGSQVRRFRRQP